MSEHAQPDATAAEPPAVMPPSGCPDENALAELVQGLLDDVVAAELEVHLDSCEECRRIVSSVGQSSYLAARRTRVDSGHAAEGSNGAAPSTWSVDGAAHAAEMKAPDPGTILAGKYRVEGVLGQGGMGVVMAATHLTLGKLVAIKLMRPDLALDRGAAQRFVREARAASLLRSEHIARVIDLDTLDDGSPYIAMEYLEGEDLGAVLARRGPIAAHEAATYIVQVCDAIAEAHAVGIVHRDLKPANLFLTVRANTPCVKVLDFGVSKIIANSPLSDDVASTDTKSLVGSPHYMAPEQLISAKAVDPRTDVWALGCILFELVAGRSPFATGAALAQVLASILRDNAPALPELRPDLPPGFVAIVERCLEKDPARRFQRVDELAAALAAFTAPHASAFDGTAFGRTTAIGVGTPAPPLATEVVPVATPSGSARVAAGALSSPSPSPASTVSSRRIGVALAALVLLAAGGYAGYRAMRSTASMTAPSPPAATPAPVAPPTAAPPPAVPNASSPAVAPPASPDAASSTVPTPATATERAPKPTRKKARKKLEDDLIGPSFD